MKKILAIVLAVLCLLASTAAVAEGGKLEQIQAAGKLGEYGIICQGQDLIVKEKLLSGELYASVAQDPFQEGSLAIVNLDKLIKGEAVDAWTYTPTGPIFAADVDNYAWF